MGDGTVSSLIVEEEEVVHLRDQISISSEAGKKSSLRYRLDVPCMVGWMQVQVRMDHLET